MKDRNNEAARKLMALIVAGALTLSAAGMMTGCGMTDGADALSGQMASEFTEDPSSPEDYGWDAGDYVSSDDGSDDSYDSDYEELGGYDAYEGPEAYDDDDYDYEEEDESVFNNSANFDDEGDDDFDDSDDYTSDDYEYEENSSDEPSGGREYGISSDTDYASDASVLSNDMEFISLPSKVGATDAVISANVTNYDGAPVTAVGCSIYYGYGGFIKSKLTQQDISAGSFDISMDIGDELDVTLDRGCTYSYKIFVEAGGRIYTHDLVRFETNDVDDKVEIEFRSAHADANGATVEANFYAPTGAEIEAVGCRFGDGIIQTSEDVQPGPYNSSEVDAVFTMDAADGEFTPGSEYFCEVYAICGGHEYSIGMEKIRVPLS